MRMEMHRGKNEGSSSGKVSARQSLTERGTLETGALYLYTQIIFNTHLEMTYRHLCEAVIPTVNYDRTRAR